MYQVRYMPAVKGIPVIRAGGAVATLCAIRLLEQFPEAEQLPFRCVGFATPSVGNHELAAFVRARGWDPSLHNILLPGKVMTCSLTLLHFVLSSIVFKH